MKKPQGKLHYYASNAFHWAVDETLPGVVRKLVAATKRDSFKSASQNVEALAITLWVVPGDISQRYEIREYRPDVVGARYLGTHRGAHVDHTETVLTQQGVGGFNEAPTRVPGRETKGQVLQDLLDRLDSFLDGSFDDANWAEANALRALLKRYHDAPLTLPLDQLLTPQEGGAPASD